MNRRESQTIPKSEIPSNVNAILALRASITAIPADVTATINRYIRKKDVATATTGFRDFSSLRVTSTSKPDSEGFHEVRGNRWKPPPSSGRAAGGAGGPSPPDRRSTGRWAYDPPFPPHLRGGSSSAAAAPTAAAAPAAPAPTAAAATAPAAAAAAAPAAAAAAAAPTEAVDVPRKINTYIPTRYRDPSSMSEIEIEKNKIQGKLNKITNTNYKQIKEFMADYLDPKETTFLTHVVETIFDMAARGAEWCKPCTLLLKEMGADHPHVHAEMLRLFNNFTSIFDTITNSGTYSGDHDEAFLREQKETRRRKGYSRFIAELVILEELPPGVHGKLLEFITTSLQKYSTSEEHVERCTAYAECLNLLVRTPTCPGGEWQSVLVAFAKLKNEELPPGLKPQAKYALLSIVEFLHLK